MFCANLGQITILEIVKNVQPLGRFLGFGEKGEGLPGNGTTTSGRQTATSGSTAGRRLTCRSTRRLFAGNHAT